MPELNVNVCDEAVGGEMGKQHSIFCTEFDSKMIQKCVIQLRVLMCGRGDKVLQRFAIDTDMCLTCVMMQHMKTRCSGGAIVTRAWTLKRRSQHSFSLVGGLQFSVGLCHHKYQDMEFRIQYSILINPEFHVPVSMAA